MTDIDIVAYYKTEYFREWYSAYRNGIRLSADDIRMRLGLK